MLSAKLHLVSRSILRLQLLLLLQSVIRTPRQLILRRLILIRSSLPPLQRVLISVKLHCSLDLKRDLSIFAQQDPHSNTFAAFRNDCFLFCPPFCIVFAVRFVQGHSESVYSVRWHPLQKGVFLSSSADWSLKIWQQGKDRALLSFDLHSPVQDACWAPFCSTMFAAVTSDGKVRHLLFFSFCFPSSPTFFDLIFCSSHSC